MLRIITGDVLSLSLIDYDPWIRKSMIQLQREFLGIMMSMFDLFEWSVGRSQIVNNDPTLSVKICEIRTVAQFALFI